MQHRLQHLLVAAGHEAEGAKDLQRRHLGLDVLWAEALGDGVDAGQVSEHVRPPGGVVHDRLDAAESCGVDGGLGRVPVHPRQQVQQTRQPGALEEPRHKAVRLRPQRDLETVKTPDPLVNLFITCGKLQLE